MLGAHLISFGYQYDNILSLNSACLCASVHVVLLWQTRVYVSVTAGRHRLHSTAHCNLITLHTRLILYGPRSFAV